VRRLEPARWSLVPSWSKELKLKYPTFNARSEGIAEMATWKGPLKSHRALVPATGYYEWQTFADGKKVPHFVHDPSGEQLVFAGLYSWWKKHTLPDDHPDVWTLTATILTSDAVDELLHIHDRVASMSLKLHRSRSAATVRTSLIRSLGRQGKHDRDEPGEEVADVHRRKQPAPDAGR
jgi:putative SOS response-associated peptidase YedK